MALPAALETAIAEVTADGWELTGLIAGAAIGIYLLASLLYAWGLCWWEDRRDRRMWQSGDRF